MNKTNFFTLRLYFIAIVTFAIWTLLVWNYFHGGIPSHHLLADENLPEVSNIWGGILLPVLTWFLLYRIQVRINRRNNANSSVTYSISKILYGFVAAVLFGIVLSTFFTFGNTDVPGYMLILLFLLAVFIPVYRSEYILGFVIGMTYTVGAVLPTLVGSILTLIGFVIYFCARPVLSYVRSKRTNTISTHQSN